MNQTATRGGWTKQPEELRRRAILDAALGCFGRKGYASTSMQDVAAAAGLTKGGVYFHFPSKEAVRDALVAELTAVERFALNDPEVLAMSPALRLREQLRRLVDGMQLDGVGVLGTIAEFATRHGAGLEGARAFFFGAVGSLAETIAAGQREGSFRTDAEPALLAELLLASADGLALHHELDSAGIGLCRGNERVLDAMVLMLSR